MWPILPTKFLFEVETALSPFARIPICPPRQGPHVGVETMAPASINISVRQLNSITGENSMLAESNASSTKEVREKIENMVERISSFKF